MEISNLPERRQQIETKLQELQQQYAQTVDRIGEITANLLAPAVDTRAAWDRVQEGNLAVVFEIDEKASLREELEHLEGRENFLTEAIAGGRAELDTLQGKLSREICQRELRPKVAARAKRRLIALKELSDCNEEDRTDRRDYESKGIRTDSVACGLFDLDKWDDEFGGRTIGYRNFIRENFPELKDACEGNFSPENRTRHPSCLNSGQVARR
jgi:chaperonin cofactor prefoldin